MPLFAAADVAADGYDDRKYRSKRRQPLQFHGRNVARSLPDFGHSPGRDPTGNCAKPAKNQPAEAFA